MAEATLKQRILQAIQELPADAGFGEVLERLYLLYRAEKGLPQAEQGQVLSDEEARKWMSLWLE